MSKNIVLIGFMGVGKSLVSNELAIKLKRKVVSTDVLVEQKAGKSIGDIFRDAGEEAFRRLERSVVGDLEKEKNLIIDCGGGIVLNQDNIDLLKKNSIMFYLSASPEVIQKRVEKQPRNRPLLNVADPRQKILQLLNQRKPKCEQADFIIDTSRHSVDDTVEEILRLLPNE